MAHRCMQGQRWTRSFCSDKLRRRSEYNETDTHSRIQCEWFDEGRKREQTVLEALSHYILEVCATRRNRPAASSAAIRLAEPAAGSDLGQLQRIWRTWPGMRYRNFFLYIPTLVFQVQTATLYVRRVSAAMNGVCRYMFDARPGLG